MARLLIHVEGETEETFVNEVLAPHLYGYGYEKVAARLIGNARLRQRRSGIRAWSSVKADIIRHLREDPGSSATTLVDYYGLPRTGAKGWPGRDRASSLPFVSKAPCVESALELDMVKSMGGDFNPRRIQFTGGDQRFTAGMSIQTLAQPDSEVRETSPWDTGGAGDRAVCYQG